MKRLILAIGSRMQQIKTVKNAACQQYIEQQKCRLFEIDMYKVEIKEIEIPTLAEI